LGANRPSSSPFSGDNINFSATWPSDCQHGTRGETK
jgi:hypothetical protein